MPIIDLLLPEFDQEMATTRRVLERCPEDKFGWRPHAKSFTMADLATHIVDMASWMASVATKDSFDFAPPGAPPYKREAARTRAELLERFDQAVAAARAALAGVTDESLEKPWTLLTGGRAILTAPRYSVLRVFAMNHLLHHRGQLSVYLRLSDAPVPSIYGPSADEKV
jgi:uncharacterized damage-inducible protein DinB